MLKKLYNMVQPETEVTLAMYEDGYRSFQSRAEAAQCENKHFDTYYYQHQVNAYAKRLKDKVNFPPVNADATYKQLSSVEKLQALCLEYKWNKSRSDRAATKAQIQKLLQEVVQQTFTETSFTPVTLQKEILSLPASTRAKLKDILFDAIQSIDDKTQKEQALWAALLPGSVLREFFRLPTDSIPLRGTSMTRGTFKQVIDALAMLQSQNENYQEMDTAVATALRHLKQTNQPAFDEFIGKLQVHAHAYPLFEALPKELKPQQAPATSQDQTVSSTAWLQKPVSRTSTVKPPRLFSEFIKVQDGETPLNPEL